MVLEPEFSEELAKAFIVLIRKGMTIREACAAPGMPGSLTVYDWLRDNEKLIGERTFRQAYHDALPDQAMSMQDEAMFLMKGDNPQGTRKDMYATKANTERAAFLMRWAREQRDALKGTKMSEGITVKIVKFGEEIEI